MDKKKVAIVAALATYIDMGHGEPKDKEIADLIKKETDEPVAAMYALCSRFLESEEGELALEKTVEVWARNFSNITDFALQKKHPFLHAQYVRSYHLARATQESNKSTSMN